MARTFRPSFFLRVGNSFATVLLRVGVKLGPMVLLTVSGRKSGKPRTTPVAIADYAGNRYVVAPYGAVNWVRNLRAAGGGTLTRGRRSEPFRAVELSAHDAAPILKLAVGRVPSFLRSYFDVTPSSPLEDYEREAPRHPVFQVIGTSAGGPGNATETAVERR